MGSKVDKFLRYFKGSTIKDSPRNLRVTNLVDTRFHIPLLDRLQHKVLRCCTCHIAETGKGVVAEEEATFLPNPFSVPCTILRVWKVSFLPTSPLR